MKGILPHFSLISSQFSLLASIYLTFAKSLLAIPSPLRTADGSMFDSFIHQAFIECLSCARYCSRHCSTDTGLNMLPEKLFLWNF